MKSAVFGLPIIMLVFGCSNANHNIRLSHVGTYGHFNVNNFKFVSVSDISYKELYPNGQLYSWGTSPYTKATIEGGMRSKGYLIIDKDAGHIDGGTINVSCNEVFQGQIFVEYTLSCTFNDATYRGGVLYKNDAKAEYTEMLFKGLTDNSRVRGRTINVAVNSILADFSDRPLPQKIHVNVTGIGAGGKGLADDYKDARINAMKNAIEAGGVTLNVQTSLNKLLTNSIYTKEYVEKIESKANAVLEPGYSIRPLGYQADGSYMVQLEGSIRVDPTDR